jgi:diguanylate cyclase (GGDEF)-like protein
LQQANNLLDNLSKTDPLTKLYNRYQLDTIAPTLIQKAINQDSKIAIVIIDIDFYKGYNDQFGHQAGDEALKIVAANISSAFSDTSIDHIFRYGGDEFLVLCDGQTDEQVIRKIHQLQSAILSLKIAHPRSYASDYLTLSIGVSNHRLYKEQPIDFNDLFNVADSALYTAKEQGRNQFHLRSDDS